MNTTNQTLTREPGLPKFFAMVSTAGGQFVKCEVQMALSPRQLLPTYQATAVEGHPFDGQRKVIVPFSRLSFVKNT
jgi:hypothetical protein